MQNAYFSHSRSSLSGDSVEDPSRPSASAGEAVVPIGVGSAFGHSALQPSEGSRGFEQSRFVATDERRPSRLLQGRYRFTCFLGPKRSTRKESSESDVDLMIVGDLGLSDLVPSLRRVEQQLGRPVNPTVYSSKEFKAKARKRDHFLTTVLRGAKQYVIGRPITPWRDRITDSCTSRRQPSALVLLSGLRAGLDCHSVCLCGRNWCRMPLSLDRANEPDWSSDYQRDSPANRG